VQESLAGGQVQFLRDQLQGGLGFRRLFGLDGDLKVLDERFELRREPEVPLMARAVGPHAFGR